MKLSKRFDFVNLSVSIQGAPILRKGEYAPRPSDTLVPSRRQAPKYANAALNDGEEYSAVDPELDGLTIGKGKGFLNAGLRWNVANNLLIEVNFKDINLDSDDYMNREVKIMYSEKF